MFSSIEWAQRASAQENLLIVVSLLSRNKRKLVRCADSSDESGGSGKKDNGKKVFFTFYPAFQSSYSIVFSYTILLFIRTIMQI